MAEKLAAALQPIMPYWHTTPIPHTCCMTCSKWATATTAASCWIQSKQVPSSSLS